MFSKYMFSVNNFLSGSCSRLSWLAMMLFAAVAHATAQDTLLIRQPDDYRLYAPLNFDSDVARRLFVPSANPGGDSSAGRQHDAVPDSLLMKFYIAHPELIHSVPSAVRRSHHDDYIVDQPLRRNTDFTHHAPSGSRPHLPGSVTLMVKKPQFWSFKGDFALQLMQNYVSGNWYKGGESSYALLGNVTVEANYNNRQRLKWENRLELKFGLQNTRSDSVHSLKANEDLIRLTSKLGLHASKRWYYTLQLVANTQFAHSYKTNDPLLYADFLAPLNVNLSVGMDYNIDWFNHRLKGTAHFAPFAYNWKYTRNLELSSRLGIPEGKHFLHDFGSQFTFDTTWEFSDLFKWKSRLYAYTSYKRVEMEWENTFSLAINRWMAAQLFVYPRFDDGVAADSRHGFWQFKEFASIGFSYSF